MVLPPPPPPPVQPTAPVVAGPVVDAGRMAWVEQDDDQRLAVRVQGRRGGVRTVAAFRRPVVRRGLVGRHSVASLALRGRRLVVVRELVAAHQQPPCAGDPCYVVPSPPPSFAGSVVSRGTVDRLRTGRVRCPDGFIGARAGLSGGGLVLQDCARSPRRVRIRLGQRTLASGPASLIGVRGHWVAWRTGTGSARVHSLRRPRRSYTVQVPGSGGLALADGGRLLSSATEPVPGACGRFGFQWVVRTATPARPRLRVAARDATGAVGARGVLVLRRFIDCGARAQIAYRTAGGAEALIGSPVDATTPLSAATDDREIAVLQAGTLQRYPVARGGRG